MPKEKVCKSKSGEFEIWWSGDYGKGKGRYVVEFKPTLEESEPFGATTSDIYVISRNLDLGIIDKNVRFNEPLEEQLEEAGATLIGRSYKPKISKEAQKEKNLKKIKEIEEKATK